MGTALVFPGQGSQAVGMGKDLADNFAEAKAVFDEVNDALGQDLSQIMWNGPEEDLKLTSNTQPALMAHSVAMLKVLEAERGLNVADCDFVAGHSLGEYSALCAAGSIDLTTTAKLLRIRGDAMQAAVPAGEGGMAAILGLGIEEIASVLNGIDGVVEIANDNCPGQIVISGKAADVEAAMVSLKEAGAKRAVPLPVSAPFHCSLMQPAAEKMQSALSEAEVHSPNTKLMANVSASVISDADDIRQSLVAQVTGQVRWTKSVQNMIMAGADEFLELGTGKVLAGLVKKIDRSVSIKSLGSSSDLES